MLTGHLRANLGPGASSQLVAEHAVAASAGLCDEFAAVSSHLAASSLRGFGTPVFIAQIPGHTFTLLGDRAVQDPIVVDPWVSYPIPDKLSTSRYNHPNLIQFNTSAAMPQDPRFHISDANVAALAPLYTGPLQPLPRPLDQDIQHDLNTSGVSSWIWNQTSSQQHSNDVWGVTNNGFINFADVPPNDWYRLDASALLPDIYAITHLQQHPNPYKRL
jgi:insecticidal toxin complex protein TccC